MTFQEIEQLVLNAMSELMQNDGYLLDHNVHEQSISGVLACYLKKKIRHKNDLGWSVDVEYNRNMDLPKSIGDKQYKPDIIVHRRGENNDTGNEDNNLLIIEIKKNPTKMEREDDISKIIAFITTSPYNYKYGLFIAFSTNTITRYELSWYKRDESERTCYSDNIVF